MTTKQGPVELSPLLKELRRHYVAGTDVAAMPSLMLGSVSASGVRRGLRVLRADGRITQDDVNTRRRMRRAAGKKPSGPPVRKVSSVGPIRRRAPVPAKKASPATGGAPTVTEIRASLTTHVQSCRTELARLDREVEDMLARVRAVREERAALAAEMARVEAVLEALSSVK